MSFEITPESILQKAIEVKEIMDELVIPVRIDCGWYGDKFVHFEHCKCEIWL